MYYNPVSYTHLMTEHFNVSESNETTVRGMRNDQAFEKIYTMQMVVNYQTNVVSVYEVEDITWE